MTDLPLDSTAAGSTHAGDFDATPLSGVAEVVPLRPAAQVAEPHTHEVPDQEDDW